MWVQILLNFTKKIEMINKRNFFSYSPHQWQPSLPLPANFYAVKLNFTKKNRDDK